MNKLLVITGGSRGIGKAIIERFAASGNFDIATCSRKASDLKAIREVAEGQFKATCVTLTCDVSKRDEVGKFATKIKELGRPVDVLVNNAGFFEPGEITTEREGALEDSINANLYSAYYLTRELVPAMREKKAGHIFNVCSVASIKAYPNGGSYAISKSALLGFSRCLREELKNDGIRVTSLIPGATRTASWDGVDFPEERFMKTEDIAELVYSSWSISKRSVVEEILIRPMLGDI